MIDDTRYRWWDAEKGRKHSTVFEYVKTVESSQAEHYDRYVKLAALYDPHGRENDVDQYRFPSGTRVHQGTTMSENVVASNVDTVAAAVSATDVRAEFTTDDAEWSEQRRARHLEWYVEALGKHLDLDEHARRAFRDCALKGMGFVMVYPDFDAKKVCVERVLADDIVVDEGECRAGQDPRQMHLRRFVDKDELKLRFPKHADEIDRAHRADIPGASAVVRYWADYRPLDRNEVVVIHSWRLPYGDPDSEHYIPGREVISVDGCDLYDAEWEKDFFPIVYIRWSPRDKGWYGIGLAERIAGHQRLLNKMNWQVDRQLDQHAVPTTYVRNADAKLAVKATNRLGTIATYKGELPKTIIPPAVSGETYKRLDDVKSSSFEESGVSRLAASSMKPAGLESGAALREYRDQTTQRFALQEKEFERFRLCLSWMVLDACKDLGPDAPIMRRRLPWGTKRIKWSQVDMGEVHVQMQAASNISRTPAGRVQTVLEYAQAGVISQDEARRLLQHPDLERAMSLYTAALENIEHVIENMLDGVVAVPEPYQNLKLGIYRVQMAMLRAVDNGAPEKIVANLSRWLVQAAWIQGKAEEAEMEAQAAAQPMPSPEQPEQPEFQAPPPGAAPVAAVAPEAIGVAPA